MFFQVDKHSFGIAETLSGYTLYCSISCPSVDEGKSAWANLVAGSDAPEGWKACSDAIPANTQHNIYDVVPGAMFFLKGCTDDKVSHNGSHWQSLVDGNVWEPSESVPTLWQKITQ